MKLNIEELVNDTIKELQNSMDSDELNKQNAKQDLAQAAKSESLYELEQIKTPEDAVVILKDEFKKSEELFLKDVKERLLVLFEGLSVNDDKTEQRLKITLEFLEFLLASIEDRLK